MLCSNHTPVKLQHSLFPNLLCTSPWTHQLYTSPHSLCTSLSLQCICKNHIHSSPTVLTLIPLNTHKRHSHNPYRNQNFSPSFHNPETKHQNSHTELIHNSYPNPHRQPSWARLPLSSTRLIPHVLVKIVSSPTHVFVLRHRYPLHLLPLLHHCNFTKVVVGDR